MLTHKIRIYPNSQQEELLKQSCGVARFAYNWGLAKWNELYLDKQKTSLNIIKTLFNKFKRESKEVSWLYDVSKCSSEYALMYLDSAFKRFFKKQGKHPVFKKKKYGRGSFSIANDKFWVKDKIAMIPKVGKIKTAEKLRFTGKIMKRTVSNTSDNWFLSISVKSNHKKCHNNNYIGIDLGLKDNLVLSNGEKYNIPNLVKQYNKVKYEQKSLSRKQKGSNNKLKQIIKVQKVWNKILNIKKDWIEKTTTKLSKQYEFIALEHLNIKGMMKNRKLSARFQQVGLYQFIERLKTKAHVFQIGRFFPSTKLCSVCNYQNDSLTLSDRFWKCPKCNSEHDRDVNAAMNILAEAIGKVKPMDKEALALGYA